MEGTLNTKAIVSLVLLGFVLGVSTSVKSDVLILSDKQKIKGEISLIADDYIEFKTDKISGKTEWIKYPKKKIIAIVDENGKIVYPRDKYDENALNYGKVRLRTKKDLAEYRARKRENIANQLRNEKTEKERYKMAVIVGGIASLMVMTVAQ